MKWPAVLTQQVLRTSCQIHVPSQAARQALRISIASNRQSIGVDLTNGMEYWVHFFNTLNIRLKWSTGGQGI